MRPSGNFSHFKEAYEKDGLVVVDFHFPEDLIEEARSFVEGYESWEQSVKSPQRILYQGTRVQDAWKLNRAVREIAVFPPALEFLKALYAREPLPFQTLNFPIGTKQPIHSDVVHFNCWPNDGDLCGVWVALEEIDEDNGPLVYYPGSHKLPEFYSLDFSDRGYPDYEEKIKTFIHRLRIHPRRALLKKGQAVVWAANLLHGGGEVGDQRRTRLSQVTHYFFEGSEFYWRPRLSDLTRGEISRFNPSFVPKEASQISTPAPDRVNRLAHYQFRKREEGTAPKRIRALLRKLCPPLLMASLRYVRRKIRRAS